MTSTAPVTAVVPCYRCVATIERAVASVAAQSKRPAELILVDDCSNDGTLQVLKSMQVRYGEWVKIVALASNRGAASARNAGWNVATQPYIAFLDSDDAWHPRKIEIQYGYMQQHSDVALSGHLCRQLPQDATGVPHWPVEMGAVLTVTWVSLLLRHPFVTPSVMLKRDIPQRFADGARHMEDHRLWLEIVGAQMRTVKLQTELAAVYKPVYGASGLSADMWGMERAELSNYRYLKSIKKITVSQMILLQGYSLAKYVRRMVIVYILHRRWVE